jgi:nucleoside phosphorylase
LARDCAFPAFGRGGIRVAAIGLRAALLSARWPGLVEGLGRPTVISAGLCGALAPTLAAGDVVVPDAVVGLDGEVIRCARPDRWEALVGSCPSPGGRLITTRHIVATPSAKASLFARTGAVAADMESSLIAAAAAAAALPTLVVRGVSDDARQELPRAIIDLVAPAGGLRVGRAAALLVQPGALVRALGVHRATRRALRAVATVLAAVIG